ncbi:MAG: SRPBCC family protein [Pseudomonadota bacterium]
MSALHHEIIINASMDRVWQVISDLESVKFYNPLVQTVQTISPNKSGVGAARHCVFKDGKFARERITAMMPLQSISFDLYEHQWPLSFMRWTTRIQPQGDSVLLVSDTEYAPGMGIVGRIMDALVMKRQFGKVIAQTLAQMKAYIEAGKMNHAGIA